MILKIWNTILILCCKQRKRDKKDHNKNWKKYISFGLNRRRNSLLVNNRQRLITTREEIQKVKKKCNQNYLFEKEKKN